MQLETRRFGTIEFDADNALSVPNGIPGFPAMQRVVLFAAAGSDAETDAQEQVGSEDVQALFWLQDLDDADLAFLCIVPWAIFPEYDIDIDERTLGIEHHSDVRILTLVTARRDGEQDSMTANLRAPIVVDVRKRRMQQVILSDSRWPIRAPFGALRHAGVS